MKKLFIKIISVILIAIIIYSVIPIFEETEFFPMYGVQAVDILDLTDNNGAGGSLSLACIWVKEYDNSRHWERCINHTGSGTYNGIVHTSGRRNQVTHSIATTGTYTCNTSAYGTQTQYCTAGCGYNIALTPKPHNLSSWRADASRYLHFKACLNSDCGHWIESGMCKDSGGNQLGCGRTGTCVTCGYVYTTTVHGAGIGDARGSVRCEACGFVFMNESETITYGSDGNATYVLTLRPTAGVTILDAGNPGTCTGAPGIAYGTNITYRGADRWVIQIQRTSPRTLAVSPGIHITGSLMYGGHQYYYHAGEANAIKPEVTPPSITSTALNPTGSSWSHQKTLTVNAYEGWSETVQIGLFQTNGVAVTAYGNASKNGTTYTRVLTPIIEAGPQGVMYTVKARDTFNNEVTRNVVLAYIDNKAPQLTSNTNFTDGWAKQKPATFTTTDGGIGQVQISFNDQSDYKLATASGSTFSRSYIFTGDVYKEQTRAVFYKDGLGNEGYSQVKVNKLDNTKPTITSVSKTLIDNNHKTRITMTGHDQHSRLGEGSGTTGIAITKTNVTPNLSEFKTGNSVEVENNGVYYIWSRDLVGNISEPKTIAVNEISVNVAGTKAWDDIHNVYKSRKDTVLTLYRSIETPEGEDVVEEEVATLDLKVGDETFDFGQQLKSDSEGNTYKYRVEEEYIPGYDAEYDVIYSSSYPYGVSLSILDTLKLPTYNASIVSKATGVVNNEYLKNGKVEIKGVITASESNRELEGLHEGRVVLKVDSKVTIDEETIKIIYKKAETGEEIEVTEYEIDGNEISMLFGEEGISEKGDNIEVTVEGTVTMIDSISSEIRAEGYLRDTLGGKTDINLGEVSRDELSFEVADHSVVELEVVDKETKERIENVTVNVREKESRKIVKEVYMEDDEIGVIEDLEVGDYVLELHTLNYDKGYVKPEEIELKVEDNSYQKVIMEQDYTKLDIDVRYLDTNEVVEDITIKLLNDKDKEVASLELKEEPEETPVETTPTETEEEEIKGDKEAYYIERLEIGKYKVVIEGLDEKYKYETMEIELKDIGDVQKHKIEIEEKLFKMEITKYISRVTVTQSGRTVTTETNQTGEDGLKPMVKVDIRAKELETAEILIDYKIRVKNIGDVSGYVEQIVESLPEELEYDEKLNETGVWKLVDGKLITESIKDVELNPEESREFTVRLKWKNSRQNVGEIQNDVEITKTRNDLGVKDRTEKSEDNASAMISVATGEQVIYVTVTFTSLSMLIVGIVLIKKFVLTV